MAQRFCPHCSADVEVQDGFCLLGHSVKLVLPAESLTNFRAELEQAAAMPSDRAEDPFLPTPEVEAPHEPVALSRFGALWESKSNEEPGRGADPIAAFSPYPHMNWGPTRGSGLRGLVRPRGRSSRMRADRAERAEPPEA